MRKNINKLLILVAGVTLMGCALFSNDRGVIYPMSYDQMYDTTLDALNDTENWTIVGTNQTKGRILIEKRPHLLEVESEKQVAFIVKRIEPFRTKVSLDGYGDTLFNEKFFDVLEKRYQERALTYPT